MTHFVFCHGFGFDTHFWHRLEPYFSQEKCSFIELGYFKNPMSNPNIQEESLIGIGHSLGLSKLLSMDIHFDSLIGLNSFINFLGFDQILREKRRKELKALYSSFLKDPNSMLMNFYIRCGVSELIEYTDFSNLDHELIASDFQWLEKEYKLLQVPILILSACDDRVVPESITLDNFSKHSHVKIESIMDAGHGLGFRNPSEVYEKIMSFLNDNAA